MEPITPTIRFMTPEKTRSRKLINAGRVLMYGTTAIHPVADRSGSIHVFKESTVLFVLSSSSKRGYLGLDIFDATRGRNAGRSFYPANGGLMSAWEGKGTRWKRWR